MGRDNDKGDDGNSRSDAAHSADLLARYLWVMVECGARAVTDTLHRPRSSCLDRYDTGNRQAKQEETLIRSEADLAERLANTYREWRGCTLPEADAIDRAIADAVKKALLTAVSFAYYTLSREEIDTVISKIETETDRSVLEIVREVTRGIGWFSSSQARMRKLAEAALIAD